MKRQIVLCLLLGSAQTLLAEQARLSGHDETLYGTRLTYRRMTDCLEPRRSRLGGAGGGIETARLELAFEDLVATGCENRIEVHAAETEVCDAAGRRRQDAVYTARLIAHLDAHFGGDIKTSVPRPSAWQGSCIPVALVSVDTNAAK